MLIWRVRTSAFPSFEIRKFQTTVKKGRKKTSEESSTTPAARAERVYGTAAVII